MKDLTLIASNRLKGIFALCIICHHCYQKILMGIMPESFLTDFLELLGYYGVSMFLFLSGYGLFKSVAIKGDDYINNFLHKIWVFVKIYLFCVILYILFDLFLRPEDLSLKMLLVTFTYGETLVDYGWYMQFQLLLYIIFFVIMKSSTRRISLIWLILFIYVVIGAVTKFHNYYWLSAFAFPMGCTYQKYIENKLLHLNIFQIVCPVIILWTIGCLLYKFIPFGTPRLMLTGLIFIPLICIVYCIFDSHIKSCSVLDWLGQISLEIYTLQGLFIYLFKNNIPTTINPWIQVLLIFASTLLAASLVQPIVKRIKKG